MAQRYPYLSDNSAKSPTADDPYTTRLSTDGGPRAAQVPRVGIRQHSCWLMPVQSGGWHDDKCKIFDNRLPIPNSCAATQASSMEDEGAFSGVGLLQLPETPSDSRFRPRSGTHPAERTVRPLRTRLDAPQVTAAAVPTAEPGHNQA